MTFAARLRLAVRAARRELRSPPPVVWELADPRAANQRFDGRVIVVTGAAGLLGSVLVESFLAAGAHVHAVDIDAAGLGRLHMACVDTAGRLTDHLVDLGDPVAIARFAETLRSVDVLVNNVGYNDDIRGPNPTAESWRRVLDINLVGPALLTGLLESALTVSRDASVVFITSVNGVHPSPWLHYAAAKAALSKVVVDLAHQLAPNGVRVNAVAPGVVRMAGESPNRRAASGGAIGGGAVPVEAIVNAVLFLADTRSSPMTTGQQLVVDGAIGTYRDGHYDPALLERPS
jgi:NAD(P)-dependent dehydrogenase (short-subunit alcohol dehydrogenase family)